MIGRRLADPTFSHRSRLEDRPLSLQCSRVLLVLFVVGGCSVVMLLLLLLLSVMLLFVFLFCRFVPLRFVFVAVLLLLSVCLFAVFVVVVVVVLSVDGLVCELICWLLVGW